MNDKTINSLFAEDIIRRVFLLELNKKNILDIINLAQNLDNKFKSSGFIVELEKVSKDDRLLDEMRWEFNTLFVGPRRPKASPYESVYFDYHLMFGKQTMEVREFYEKLGLKIKELDKFPDDYIGFEFEYLYFASYKIQNSSEDQKDEIVKNKLEFIKSHPQQWFYKFGENCDKFATQPVWQNLHSFLKLYLENEIDSYI